MDDHVETLRRYNRWRRGQDCEEMQDPRVVGDAIDAACDKIDRLRAELICVCNLLVYRGRHAEDGKYCEICEVVARARKIAAARKGEGDGA